MGFRTIFTVLLSMRIFLLLLSTILVNDENSFSAVFSVNYMTILTHASHIYLDRKHGSAITIHKSASHTVAFYDVKTKN